jgi:hypothetical protein
MPELAAALGLAGPDLRFLVFGFGDRAYFMSRRDGLPDLMLAMLPGPGVILVTALRASPERAFGADHTVALPATAAQFGKMTMFLRQELAVGADGMPQRLGDGPYAGSAFFATADPYDVLHNCNGWTLEALRGGGWPAHPDGVILAHQVIAQARRLAMPPADRHMRGARSWWVVSDSDAAAR